MIIDSFEDRENAEDLLSSVQNTYNNSYIIENKEKGLLRVSIGQHNYDDFENSLEERNKARENLDKNTWLLSRYNGIDIKFSSVK